MNTYYYKNSINIKSLTNNSNYTKMIASNMIDTKINENLHNLIALNDNSNEINTNVNNDLRHYTVHINTVTKLFKEIHIRNKNISVASANYIDNNININQQDMYGNTPMFYSIKFNNKLTLFEAILQRGGDLKHTNIFGYSPIMYMFLYDRYEYIQSLLHIDVSVLYQTIEPFDAKTYNIYMLLLLKNKVPKYDHSNCIIKGLNDNKFFKKVKHGAITSLTFDYVNIRNNYIGGVTAFMLCFKYCDYRTVNLVMHYMIPSDKLIVDNNGHNLFNYLDSNVCITEPNKRLIKKYFNHLLPEKTNSQTSYYPLLMELSSAIDLPSIIESNNNNFSIKPQFNIIDIFNSIPTDDENSDEDIG